MGRDSGAVSRTKALERAGEDVRIPAPALFELWRGVHLAARTAPEAQRVTGLLALYPVVPLDAEAARVAGRADAELLRLGQAMDPEDSMIAGITLSLGETLLTRNVRHFSRVSGLRIQEY